MLVEFIEVSPENWEWTDTNGVKWLTTLIGGATPVEVKHQNNEVKSIIKLKREGFSAQDIVELKEGGLL